MLTLPTVDEFYAFWGNTADDMDPDRAELLINLAADLMYVATNLDNDPADPRLAQLVRYGICDMAVYLYLTRDSINEQYSPFQSERVGSYSYSKAFARMSRTVTTSHNEPTGVAFFDRAVAVITDELTYGSGTIVGGVRVHREYYVPLAVESLSVHYPLGSPDDTRPLHHYYGDADRDTGLYR